MVDISARRSGYIIQHQLIEIDGFGEVARDKADGGKFGVVEDVSLQKHGRGDIHCLAYIREVSEKIWISELIHALVNGLIYYFSVL